MLRKSNVFTKSGHKAVVIEGFGYGIRHYLWLSKESNRSKLGIRVNTFLTKKQWPLNY
jgi:hypothetical protein